MCFMRMLSTSVDFEFLNDLTTQFVMGNHAPYSGLNDSFWMAIQNLACRYGLNPTWISTVAIVPLGLKFVTCQMDLLGVDDDHMIASVHVWSVCWPMLSSENRSHLSS